MPAQPKRTPSRPKVYLTGEALRELSPAKLIVIDGGNGEIPTPDWDALFLDDPGLAERAAEIWRLTIGEMKDAGTLAAVNVNQVRRYVVACVMFDDAVGHVTMRGPVITNTATEGNAKMTWNPWWSVMKDADTMASNHEDKLGLNPRRRGVVTKVQKKARTPTAADTYLAAKT